MRNSTIWTVLGVIAAIVIAWILVNVLFSLIAIAFKLLIVAVVAVIVFFVLRSVFGRSRDGA
jgi:ABC-type transport system involved in cytochrome bd biosynthesis fused ATPase/permease subunit